MEIPDEEPLGIVDAGYVVDGIELTDVELLETELLGRKARKSPINFLVHVGSNLRVGGI